MNLKDYHDENFYIDEDFITSAPPSDIYRSMAGLGVKLEEEAVRKILSMYADPPIDCYNMSLYMVKNKIKEQNIAMGQYAYDDKNRRWLMQDGKRIGPEFYLEFSKVGRELKVELKYC